MTNRTLDELAREATLAKEPNFVARSHTKFGGIDPLGLRQINFDLMDEVLPGLNNVARHIRPFVVVAWAWRRAHQRAAALESPTVRQGDLHDFVDRIEVLFALSQLLRNRRADIPGSQFLAPRLSSAEFNFGGDDWQGLRKRRQESTSLSAAINYGPGLKMLGWIIPHPEYPALRISNPAVAPALDAFESEIKSALKHPAFNELGDVTVSKDELIEWAELWPMDQVTNHEASVMADLLFGSTAPVGRQQFGELLVAAVQHLKDTRTATVRAVLSGPPSTFTPPAHLLPIRDSWRMLQVRQLFRLSLEAFFFWTMRQLDGPTRLIDDLVLRFLERLPTRPRTTEAWILSLTSDTVGPTELMDGIDQAFEGSSGLNLPEAIARGLALCLSEATPDLNQPRERLPLFKAQTEFKARAGTSVADFVQHVIESWVIAQHSYWSVGRGLADARVGGRVLLRLRIILDEGGWTLTPGAPTGGRPQPTPDRLHTALTLASECGYLNVRFPVGVKRAETATVGRPAGTGNTD